MPQAHPPANAVDTDIYPTPPLGMEVVNQGWVKAPFTQGGGPFKRVAGLRLSPPPASREPPRRGGLSGAQRLMAPSARELSAKLTEGENLPIEPIIPCASKE